MLESPATTAITPTPIPYDLTSHHALGGGSYAFQKDYAGYLQTLLRGRVEPVQINVIIQPNSSPHVGTLSSICLAFVVARRLQDLGTQTLVVCDLWDHAKGQQVEINGLVYQRSLAAIGTFQQYLPEYQNLVDELGERYDISYKLRCEEEFLCQPGIPNIIRRIIKNRKSIGSHLQPASGVIALRAACPTCGLVEKRGLCNIYLEDQDKVQFTCPHHGEFTYAIESQSHCFQFNCQLYNLVLGLFYESQDHGYIEICGSDYAGFWQEQLLWRFLSRPIIIVYTPLISDWSGYKISKSLYLQRSAYDYLRAAGMEYLLSYTVALKERRDLRGLWQEIERWVDEPYRLFRGYSLHYVHLLLSGGDIRLGVIH